MKQTDCARGSRFRVWIAAYDRWQPTDFGDVPTAAVAIEPAEDGTMSKSQADAYVEAFNRAALGGRRKIWAVALPVTVRYQGDPRPGEKIDLWPAL